METFAVQEAYADEERKADYNVTPAKTPPTILARVPNDAGPDAEPVRELRNVRWGLVPAWAKTASKGINNARAETVHEKPTFKKAFATRRLLVPVDGFYEWFPTQQVGKGGKPLKQPFFIHPANGQGLALAGLYGFWKDPEKSDDDPDRWLTTFTIITTTATDDVGRIHDRMPMAVTPDKWAAWLDPRLTDVEDVRSLMAPPVGLDIYAVSTAVNNSRNNGPELLEPIPAESPAGESH